MSTVVRVYAEGFDADQGVWRMLADWCPNRLWDGVAVPDEPDWKQMMDYHWTHNADGWHAILFGGTLRKQWAGITGGGFGLPRGIPEKLSPELAEIIGKGDRCRNVSWYGLDELMRYPWERVEQTSDAGQMTHAELSCGFAYDALLQLLRRGRERSVRIVYFKDV